MSSLRELAAALREAASVTLVCHLSPDGDTVGAVCALALGLEAMGKAVVRCCADRVPARLLFLKGSGAFTQDLERAGQSEIIMAVDCAAPDRMGPARALLELGRRVLVLDHHGTNEGFGDLCHVCSAPSVSEAAQQLLELMEVPLTADMADALYTGIVTDTGRFGYAGVTGDTLRQAAKTVDAGADYAGICRSQFQTRTLAATRLLGTAIGSMTLHMEGRVAVMTVTAEDLARCQGSLEDMEGIVNYASEVEGVDIGVMLYPASGRWKVSLRAGERASVDGVARMMGGGGHSKAAGCRASGTQQEALELVLETIGKAGALQ